MAFRSALTELYSDIMGDLTQRLFLIKYKQNLAPDTVAKFNNIIQLYSTRAIVGKYNYNQLQDLQRTIVAIKSINSGIGAVKATYNQYKTVLNLIIYIGAKVMLI